MTLTYWVSIPSAAIAGWLIATLWHSRWLFGRAPRASGEGSAVRPAPTVVTRLGAVAAFFLMAAVLRVFVSHLGADSLHDGAGWGFHAWVGIALPLGLLDRWHGERPWAAFLRTTGCQLVYLTAMGAILGVWR